MSEPFHLAGAFVQAVENGDCAAVRSLVAEHPDLRLELDAPRSDLEQPAVVMAANRGDRAMVATLLSLGADINARSQFWGRTVGVLDESPADLRDFLIENGAVPELSSWVTAVQEQDLDACRQLLESCPVLTAHINRPHFPSGAPAIHAARENLELVDLLLAFGADIKTRSAWEPGGFGVLDGVEPELGRELIARGAVVDIHAAASLGMLDEVRRMLAEDPALANARGGDGQRPLHVARTPDVVDALLAHGADVDQRDEDHLSTPAQYQVIRPDNCRRLVERGAQPDLFMAAALGELDWVRVELARNPNSIHARLHQPGYDRVPSEAPTIYNWRLGFRHSPHQVAHEKGHLDVFRHLMEHSPPAERFINACLCGEEENARALAANHPDLVKSLAPRDRARFTDAVWCGNLPAARLMLELGFDVDERDGEGTALCGALLFGNREMVELLLPHKPDLTVRNLYHATPLGVCIWASVNFHVPEGDYAGCARLLLEAGAELSDEMRTYGTEAVCQAVAASRPS